MTADSPDQEQTQEIVVTAQKRQQSLNDVGATINVVSGEVLAQRAITTMADLSRLVPGFTVAENVDGFPIYTLRGVSFNATAFGTAPTVSVYVDEAPLPFSVMTQGAVLLDLERVEVLKGPPRDALRTERHGRRLQLHRSQTDRSPQRRRDSDLWAFRHIHCAGVRQWTPFRKSRRSRGGQRDDIGALAAEYHPG